MTKKTNAAINGEMSAFAAPGIPGMSKRELIAMHLYAQWANPEKAVYGADQLLEELSK